MKLSTVSQFAKRPSSDVLVVLLPEGEKPFVQEAPLKEEIASIYKLKDFSGKKGESLFFYSKSKKEKRVLLVGLGSKEKLDLEAFRRTVGENVRKIHGRKLSSAVFCLPTNSSLFRKRGLGGVCGGGCIC